MTIVELADEYEKQYNILNAKMDGLKPLLYVYSGNELYLLRRRLKTYYDMACECKRISRILNHYYEEDSNDRLY